MPPTVIDSNRGDDERDAVHRAVEALAKGKLVAFPTETVYGIAASALDESAVGRLLETKGRKQANPLALAIKNADEAESYCPNMSPLAQRLSRRCWPGPITLVLRGDHADGLARRFPSRVRQAVLPTGSIGLRVPDHRYILHALRLLPGPLVLTSANRSGNADALTAEEVVDALGDDVDLVLSDGRTKYAKPSTVVRVVDNRLAILRQGVMTESVVKRCASLIVLVVCTGNTCRSPMAQVLLQKRIADRLECSVAELEQRGIMVVSAGVAAARGVSASLEAVQAMEQRSLDLSAHESQPLTDVLVRFADVILTMTHGHRGAIVSRWPDAASRTALLRRDDGEIPDPFGGSLERYIYCADQIDAQMKEWMEPIDWESTPIFESGSGA